MSISVGNLSYDTTQDDLDQIFSKYGSVEAVNIISDRETGRSRGYGFVELSSDAEEASAIEALNGAEVQGREISVSKAADPREPRSGRRSR